MSILLFILFGSITLSFWSVCIASSRADKVRIFTKGEPSCFSTIVQKK